MNDFKKNSRRRQGAFLDVNVFSHEGFTSGALIYMKEILSRMGRLGIPSGVLSLVTNPAGRKRLLSKKTKDGITIEELKLEIAGHPDGKSYAEACERLLHGFKWGAIFMNSPAVILDEAYNFALESALDHADNVVMVVPDVLFPTVKTNSAAEVRKLYRLMRRTITIVPSNFVRKKLKTITGIQAKVLPNIFDRRKIISPDGNHQSITMINHHPMKGRDIFNAIALKLPHETFMIVENWPDVPEYVPVSPNIRFHNFFKDVRELYSQSKLILVPSLCEEGCPRVISEALLNGIPVIAHNIGGIKEAGLGMIHLLRPPKIKGLPIAPTLDEEELDKISDRFVSTIFKIGKDKPGRFKKDKSIQNSALQHIQRSEELTGTFLKNLFK